MDRQRARSTPRSDAAALLSLYEETAFLRDGAEFRRTLFRKLEEILGVPLAALCRETPSGLSIHQSRGPSDPDRPVDDADVIAEQRQFLSTLPNPAVAVLSRSVSEPALRESVTYHRIWRPEGLRDGVVGTAGGPRGSRSMLVLLDADRSAARLSRLKRFLDRLLPYVDRALEQFDSLERLAVRISTLEEVSRTAGAAALVDPRGRVVWTSQAARDTFRESTGREAPPDSVLFPSRPEGESTTIVHRGRRLVVRARPVRSDGRVLTLVTIEDPDERRREDLSERCRRFGLTAREREVADLVVAGLLDKEILRILPISRDTLRRHLANVFARTGARNRVDLIRILLGSAGSPV